MKTITITIQVPDGVEVRVAQGQGGGNGRDRPFVERPDPPYPEGVSCPVHGTGWRMVKGGTSKKTGKRFNSFWVCATDGCDEKPPRDAAPVSDYQVDELPF